MEHSLRLKKFYGGKKSFSLNKRTKLSEMALKDAILAETIPEEPQAKREFATELLSVATNAMGVFESIARESDDVQAMIQEISRYSSFLDHIVPYKVNEVNSRVLNARVALNNLRTLFSESLANNDMMSSRTVSSGIATFIEIANFERFFRSFGEYMVSVNVTEDSPELEQIRNDYFKALDDIAPGNILSLVMGVDASEVFSQQVKLIDDQRAHGETSPVVATGNNVLCWTTARSYMDLPSRMLAKAGPDPTYAMERIFSQVHAVSEMNIADEAQTGIGYLAEWAVLIHNGMINVLALTRQFVILLDATLDCLWEFFFYQLKELEERAEVEVLESVLVMCQQSIFEEVNE